MDQWVGGNERRIASLVFVLALGYIVGQLLVRTPNDNVCSICSIVIPSLVQIPGSNSIFMAFHTLTPAVIVLTLGGKRRRPDPIVITKPAIRRLARRGGVKRINALVYQQAREIVREFLSETLGDALTYTA